MFIIFWKFFIHYAIKKEEPRIISLNDVGDVIVETKDQQ